jgi:hypothetical protein
MTTRAAWFSQNQRDSLGVAFPNSPVYDCRPYQQQPGYIMAMKTGRKPLVEGHPMSKMMTFTCTPKFERKMTRVAEQIGQSRSAFIRAAIEAHINNLREVQG